MPKNERLPRPLAATLVILAALWAIALILAYQGIAPHIQGNGAAADFPTSVASGTELLLCALPFVLTGCIALLLESQDDRVIARLELPPNGDDELEREIIGLWEGDAERMRRVRRALATHAFMFGGIATVGLVCCALTITESLAIVHPTAAEQEAAKLLTPAAAAVAAARMSAAGVRLMIAVAAAAATAVSFTIAFAQILVRASRQDMAPRALSGAVRSLIIVALTTVVVVGTLAYTERVKEPIEALIGGVCVGIIGDRLFETFFDALDVVFGVSSGPDDNLDNFRLIDGLDEEERLRLSEQAISSLQSLAFASTPLLFFSTRYNFWRICDWQDQALLFLMLGKARASAWRHHFLVRGASDARDLAARLCPANGSSCLYDASLLKRLGFDSEAEAHLVIEQLKAQREITRIQYWKQCTPRLPPPPTSPPA